MYDGLDVVTLKLKKLGRSQEHKRRAHLFGQSATPYTESNTYHTLTLFDSFLNNTR